MAKKLEKKGVPAYMVTLGDMWSLMLTFFIMLFAMSQVDATKFKQVEGSIKTTFGFKQSDLDFGPPPGVSVLKDPTASASSGTDISFFEPANNSIIDPQLASLKIMACERQMKKDANDVSVSKKNGALIRRILADEIKAGLFRIVEDGKEVSLLFAAEKAFDENRSMYSSMRKGLIKLGVAFASTNGSILVRSYMPKSANGKATYKDGTRLAGEIGEMLVASERLSFDRIEVESMSNARAPASVKAYPESLTQPFFEVSVFKD